MLLGFSSQSFGEGLLVEKAMPKILKQLTGALTPYRSAYDYLVKTVLQSEKVEDETIRRKLEDLSHQKVTVEFSPGTTNDSYNFALENQFYFYVTISSDPKEARYGFLISKYGRSLGNCSFEFGTKKKLKSGSCEVYVAESLRDRAIFYDDQVEVKKIDYFRDPPVLSLNEIYGRTFDSPKDAVKVGIVDSGVDYNHRALARSIPRALNGKNEWTIAGYDFFDNDPLAFDIADDSLASHGTGVAAMVVGVEPSAEIIPVRYPSSGELFESIAFARNAGAQIINLSLGVSKETSAEVRKSLESSIEKAIREFEDVTFVVASGNESLNVDSEKFIPQSLHFPNLIVVGSVSKRGRLTKNEFWGSNFSKFSVQVAALGEDLKVPVPGGTYEVVGGTSFAAPQVAGVLAKYKRETPKASPSELIEKIRQNLVAVESLKDSTVFGGVPAVLKSSLDL